MCETIWVVKGHWQYEGFEILGCFKEKEDAEKLTLVTIPHEYDSRTMEELKLR